MAVVDEDRGAVVLRIVYDGPPRAGKTTSVRALARSLARPVETPLESEGRTMFFDWLEYTGGLFDGRQLRCQIVSVPGQPDLAARRRALLESADAVVFVADSSSRAGVERGVAQIRELVELLGTREGPPVGVIVQANKRDVPGAIPREELRAALEPELARAALTESVAEAGTGIRETFVFAVRLALDRLRGVSANGALPRGRPAAETAGELLAQLERLPAGPRVAKAEDAPAVHAATKTAAPSAPEPPTPSAPPTSTAPLLPDARVPSDAIWPPVEGRVVLHEASAAPRALQRLSNGDWAGGIGGPWRSYSAASDVYRDFDEGRRALLAWAREHAACSELLSPARCIVLAESAPETWRLWQIVRAAPSLRGWILDGERLDTGALYDRLARGAAFLGEAHARFAGTRLVPSLDSVGAPPGGPRYVWLMPRLGAEPRPPPGDVEDAVAREISSLLAAELADRLGDLVEEIVAGAPRTSRWETVVAIAVADCPR